jgi:hypothetical protein
VKEAEVASTYALLQERVEFLNKYASAATELLSAEFPNNFDKADVVELADKLIQRDAEIAETQEKVAEATAVIGEYVKVARTLLETENGKDFTDTTVEKLASALFEIDAKDQFFKEAGAIGDAAFLDEFNKLAGTEFESIESLEEAVKEAAMPEIFGKGLAAIKGFGTNMAGKAADFAMKNPKTTAGIALGGAAGAGVVAGRMSKSGGDN